MCVLFVMYCVMLAELRFVCVSGSCVCVCMFVLCLRAVYDVLCGAVCVVVVVCVLCVVVRLRVCVSVRLWSTVMLWCVFVFCVCLCVCVRSAYVCLVRAKWLCFFLFCCAFVCVLVHAFS